jgi:hypothetical protein
MAERRAASRPFAVALLVAGLVLALTADERVFGLGTDGRIMLRTAVAMVRLGEIGIARGQAVDVPRAGGDAVSRYGMGQSLVLAVPALLAGGFERSFGAGASQTLFVLEQILFVLLAAFAAGLFARALGGDERTAGAAILATALASPLWAYVALDFSEPLQAAASGSALALAAHAARMDGTSRRDTRLAALSGFLAGFSLLAKSLLVVLIPLVASVVAFSGEPSRRKRRVAAVLAGTAPPALLWLVLELVRFGRPFASYEGEHFGHPVMDGLWRLTVGPNKGLFLYFPLAILAVFAAAALFRKARAAILAGIAFSGFLLVSAAAWWAWDGTFGWGPRLLMPCIPILAALAASAPVPPAVFRTLFAVGFAVNGLAALQPESLTSWTYKVLPRRELSAAEAARFPSFAFERMPDGRIFLFNQYGAANHAALGPVPLAGRLLLARLHGGGIPGIDAALWKSDNPGLRPVSSLVEAVAPTELVHLVAPFRWPYLGMSLSRRKGQIDQSLAYIEALLDQANRAQDMGRADRALGFGEELFAMHPNPQTAVVLAEGYRLAGRRETLAAFAQEILRKPNVDPDLGVVLALAARDAGDPAGARKVLEDVSGHVAVPDVEWLLARPPADWPSTLREIRRARQAGAASFDRMSR